MKFQETNLKVQTPKHKSQNLKINRLLIHKILTLFVSLVWLINGLFCKILNLVPRHQLIVSEILGPDISFIATKTIGVLEILMCIWILSGIKSRWCVLMQIGIILLMNCIEFMLVPYLLLFGRFNLIIAIFFTGSIAVNEFYFKLPKKDLIQAK